VALGRRESERQSWWVCGGYIVMCHFCVWRYKGVYATWGGQPIIAQI